MVPLARSGLDHPYLLIDIVFLGANMLKVHEGGWMPLALGGAVMLLMYTWRSGSRLLSEKTRRQETPLRGLVAMFEEEATGPGFGNGCVPHQRPDECANRTDAQPRNGFKCSTRRTSF